MTNDGEKATKEKKRCLWLTQVWEIIVHHETAGHSVLAIRKERREVNAAAQTAPLPTPLPISIP